MRIVRNILYLLLILAVLTSCGTRKREKSREQVKTRTELKQQIDWEASDQKETLKEATKITQEQINQIVENLDFESIDQDKDFQLNIGFDEKGNLNISGRNARGSKSSTNTNTSKSDTATSKKKEVWRAEAKEAVEIDINQYKETDKLDAKVDTDKGNWLDSLSWSLFWIVVIIGIIFIIYYKRTSIFQKINSLFNK